MYTLISFGGGAFRKGHTRRLIIRNTDLRFQAVTMETVGGRLQSLSCTDVRLAGHGGEGKHYPYSQAPVRKHRALSLGFFFYTSNSVVMKQRANNKYPQPLNVAALCLLPNIPCSASQRKAIKKGKRKKREKRQDSLAAKKISFKD